MRPSLVLATLACVAASSAVLGCGRDSPSAPPSNTTPSSTSASGSETTTKGSSNAGELAVGKPAPDFAANAHDGMEIKPSALGGKHVVLYFYPRDETPGCTKEACAFRDAWKELEATGVVLVGISTDTDESHKKFAEHHKLPFHLVSDPDGAIAKSYGVSNNGGFLSRHTIVIGPDGKVKKIYRSVDVSKHAAEVLADVKS